MFDLEEVNRTISSVVKIDRLPKHNSMEALLSLQDAWDHVDAYHRLADFYKMVTKLSYGLLLLAGLATSVIAIIRGAKMSNLVSLLPFFCVFVVFVFCFFCLKSSATVDCVFVRFTFTVSSKFLSIFLFPVSPTEKVDDSSGEANNNTSSQWIILGLSLLVTTVVGYVNFMNPAQRWQQLRGNVL